MELFSYLCTSFWISASKARRRISLPWALLRGFGTDKDEQPDWRGPFFFFPNLPFSRARTCIMTQPQGQTQRRYNKTVCSRPHFEKKQKQNERKPQKKTKRIHKKILRLATGGCHVSSVAPYTNEKPWTGTLCSSTSSFQDFPVLMDFPFPNIPYGSFFWWMWETNPKG